MKPEDVVVGLRVRIHSSSNWKYRTGVVVEAKMPREGGTVNDLITLVLEGEQNGDRDWKDGNWDREIPHHSGNAVTFYANSLEPADVLIHEEEEWQAVVTSNT